MWGGRFSTETSTSLKTINSSLNVDKRLYREDIIGSQVYAGALYKADLLTKMEYMSIDSGLNDVLKEWDSGIAELSAESAGDEDIHSAVERRLHELIGASALKLNTGRSRNDQVATDLRLWMLGAIDNIMEHLRILIKTIVNKSEQDIDVLMPGYTHLQQAQIVRWSHVLMSYAWSFKDDVLRFKDSITRLSVLPLGSGAIAGNPFPVDRESMALKLGFNDVTRNSMYGVGNRDFVAEFLFDCTLCSIHLSRLSEDLIIFSTSEFGYVTLSDKWSSGSSLMPQKRNPDGFELARGMAACMIGDAFGFMATLKGLPGTYNKDLQMDKETVFKVYDRFTSILKGMDEGIQSLTVNSARCAASLDPNMLAADLAYYLVRRGVPFREAHHMAGRAVRRAEELQIPLDKLPLSELNEISIEFKSDVVSVWSRETSVEQYSSIGGTSKSSVQDQIKSFRKWLDD